MFFFEGEEKLSQLIEIRKYFKILIQSSLLIILIVEEMMIKKMGFKIVKNVGDNIKLMTW